MVFDAFKIIIAYLLPTIIGIVLLSWLEKGRQRWGGGEKIALGFVLGSGILGFYMFYLAVLKIPFSFWTISPLFLVFFFGGLIIVKKQGFNKLIHFSRPVIFDRKNMGGKVLVAGLAVLLFGKMLLIGFNVIFAPTYFDDSVANYNYKAKVFYYNRSVNFAEEHPDYLGGYRPAYPQGISLIKTWVTICLGHWEEYAVNLYTLFVFIALGVISYFNLVRIISRLLSFIFTYILLSIPLLTFHGGYAHIDIVVGLYFFSGIVYLIRWIREGDRHSLFLSAFLFGIGLSIKDEMLALFVCAPLLTLVTYQIFSRVKIKNILKTTFQYIGVALILNVPWFITKFVYQLQMGPRPDQRAFEFHPEAFKILASYLFNTGNYNILWPVFFCSIILSCFLPRKTELKYILISISGALFITLYLFIFTPFFEFLKIGTTINRALLIILPVIIFYLATFYGKIISSRRYFD